MSLRKLLKTKGGFWSLCLAMALICVLAWSPIALASGAGGSTSTSSGSDGGGNPPDYGPGNAAGDAARIADMYNKWREMEDKEPPGGGGSSSSSGPDYNPPGMPEVPTSCDGKQGCWQCYESANKRLERLRISFEKLRILYKETDDYTKAAMAFGDSVAGASNLGALEWTAQRLKILKSWKNFEAAYRKKHYQLVNELKAALQEVAKCEKKYFGMDDWYARYGYMFHSFMAMYYQR